ncbi:MAG: hypothetical protein ACLGIG_00570, partial [Actinomycetes bacterium]
RGTRPSPDQGIWSVSEPVPHDVWMAGEPVITVGVGGSTVPGANLAANVYDVAPDGKVTMISRGVTLLRGTGQRSATVTMYGQDWVVRAGHRLAVLVSSANTDEFLHVATRTPVTVEHAKITLPFLTEERTRFLTLDGSNPRLDAYLEQATSVCRPRRSRRPAPRSRSRDRSPRGSRRRSARRPPQPARRTRRRVVGAAPCWPADRRGAP